MKKAAESRYDSIGGVDEAFAHADPGQVVQSVAAFARENPHAALAAAAGIGFLLGGGLTPRLLGAIGLFAAKHYFREAVQETLHELVGEGGALEQQDAAS
jgi:hypothetical protein